MAWRDENGHPRVYDLPYIECIAMKTQEWRGEHPVPAPNDVQEHPISPFVKAAVQALEKQVHDAFYRMLSPHTTI